VSEVDAVKPDRWTKPEKRLCHARGACLSPYKDFCRRQTWSGAAGSTKPGGC
jgi:hypothetical protein